MKQKFYTLIFCFSFLLSIQVVKSQVAISTYEELYTIQENLQGNYFLTNDITIPEGIEWLPIGASSTTASEAPAEFSGVFDGKGYSIKNLTISTGTNFKGLFGRINHAVVCNLNLENVKIVGGDGVGGIAGAMLGESRIEKVSVTGSLSGTDCVGGIIGRTGADSNYPGYNSVKNCYSNVAIHSEVNGAGIVGQARASVTIENVYARGSVQTSVSDKGNNASGILSNAIGGKYVKCQLKSIVTLQNPIYGATSNLFFGGRNVPMEVFENAYARNDIELHYILPDDKGLGGDLVEGADFSLLPLEDFRAESFYKETLDWDFENVWTMGDEGYPVLKNTTSSVQNSYRSDLFKYYISADKITVIPQEGALAVRIYDMTGKLRFSETIISNTAFALSRGLYILNVESNKEKHFIKFIVK